MKKGQMYTIATFIFLSYILYNVVYFYLDQEERGEDTSSLLLYNTVLDLLYANYSTSCENLKVLFSFVYGNIKFAYVVFVDGKISSLCDPYNLINRIYFDDGSYVLVLENKKISIILEEDIEKYVAVIKEDKDKIYIKEGFIK